MSFDPRGVSRSHEIRCSAELLDKPRWEVPKDKAQFQRLKDINTAFAEDCRKHEEMGFHQGWGIATDQLEAVARSL